MTPLSPTALEEAAKAIYETWARNRSIDETWFGVCHVQHSIANEARQEATAAITAYLAQREKEGFVEVPREATQVMLDAGYYPATQRRGAKSVWQCMLAAAQNEPVPSPSEKA